jgi:hypothetical protein
MFQIKNFIDFSNSFPINEDASDVWKFDPETPDSGDLAKFSFKAKVQHREGAGEQEIGNTVANFLNNKLATEDRFVGQLKLDDRIPVMYTNRNTSGGFFTGDRGVLTGNIIFVGRKFYDEARLKALEPFKPKGATLGVSVKGFKIYDETLLDSAKKGATGQAGPTTAQAATPAAPDQAGLAGAAAASAAAMTASPSTDKTQQILNTLMNFKFGAKSNLIKWVNAAMTVLDDSLTSSLINKGVINDTYNNEMAAAIQKIVGETAPVTKITQEVATAIKAKLDTITTDQVNTQIGKYTTDVVPTGETSTLDQFKTYLIGLKQGDKNAKVGMLQNALSIMDEKAKAAIDKKGGIDNNYGGATAQALQIVTGAAAPVTAVTEDVVKALIEKASKLTPEKMKQVTDALAAALNAALSGGGGSTDKGSGTDRKTGKKTGSVVTVPTGSVVTTSKGTKLTFL